MVSRLQRRDDNQDCRKISNDSLDRALNLLSREGLEGAITIVESELQNDPESWEAWAAKADILYFKGANVAALECCDRSLRIKPGNALAWNTKGNALYNMGRYDEAISCYSMAIKLEPLFIRAWRNKKMALEVQLSKSKPRIARALKGKSDHR